MAHLHALPHALLPTETPHSLVQRGLLQEGQEALRHIRGPFVSNASLQDEALLLWQAAGCPAAETRNTSRVRVAVHPMPGVEAQCWLLVSLTTACHLACARLHTAVVGGAAAVRSVQCRVCAAMDHAWAAASVCRLPG